MPRLQDVVFIAVFGAALLSGRDMLNTDGDLGRHLTMGRIVISTLRVPTQDLLSHTLPGQSRPPYEWLAQVLIAGADRIMGLDGVVLLTATALAATFALIFREAVRRSAMPLLALFFTSWAAAASSLHWLTRPHIFSFLLLTVWLERLEALRDGRISALWHFPLIMVVWANTHGGFVFGLLAWLAYCAGSLWDSRQRSPMAEGLRRWLLVGAASISATVLTPDSWHNWEAVLANHSRYVLDRTVETMRPELFDPGVRPFTALLATGVVLLVLNRQRVAGAHLILLAGLAGMGILMARNIPLFAIAAGPIMTAWASQVSSAIPGWQRLETGIAAIDARLRGSVWPILCAAMAGILFVGHFLNAGRRVFVFDPGIFPVGAADWLSQHPPSGKMYNDFNWGGYLLYRLWPDQRVFVDSQSDFYGEPFLRQYESIMVGGRDWQQALDDYGVGWLIVPTGSGVAKAARGSSTWEAAYEDPVAVIFVRR